MCNIIKLWDVTSFNLGKNWFMEKIKTENERTKNNRIKEQGRKTRQSSPGNLSRVKKLDRFSDWDIGDGQKNTWLRTSFGEFKNRYFEED